MLHFLALIESLPHLFAHLPLDDNTLGVLALLLGVVAGWILTDKLQQMKAKKVKVEREQDPKKRGPNGT